MKQHVKVVINTKRNTVTIDGRAVTDEDIIRYIKRGINIKSIII